MGKRAVCLCERCEMLENGALYQLVVRSADQMP